MPKQANASSTTKKSKDSSYHHGDLKASLIQAANSILQRDGADSLSLRSIAAEVGVSHMAPYSHFKNKKELIQAVSSEGFLRLANQMEQDSSELSKPEELILAYGTTYLEFAITNPELYRLMLGQIDTQGRRNQKSKNAKESGNDLDQGATKETNQNTKVSLEEDAFSQGPYSLLKGAFARIYDNEEIVKAQALGAWSIVHGMAALIIEGHIQVPEGISLKQFLASAALRTGPNI